MRNYKKVLLLLFCGIALFCLGSASRVGAVPIITFETGSTTLVVVDDGVGDNLGGLDPGTGDDVPGSIVFAGNVGSDWTVSMTSGVTKPVLGSSSFPIMNLNSLQASSATAGTFIVSFNETNFNMPVSGVTGLVNAVGGFTSGDMVIDFYFGADNDSDWRNDGAAIASISSAAGNMTGSVDWFFPAGVPDPANPEYALTIVATITHTGASQSQAIATITPGTGTSPSTANPVPEPSTILLIGIGLSGLAGSRYFRKRNVLRNNRTEG